MAIRTVCNRSAYFAVYLRVHYAVRIFAQYPLIFCEILFRENVPDRSLSSGAGNMRADDFSEGNVDDSFYIIESTCDWQQMTADKVAAHSCSDFNEHNRTILIDTDFRVGSAVCYL